MMVIQKGVPVNLPEISGGVKLKKIPFHQIDIKREGNIFLDGEPIENIEELKKILRPIFLGDNLQKKLIIGGDKGAKFESVIKVMETVRELGIKRVIFRCVDEK